MVYDKKDLEWVTSLFSSVQLPITVGGCIQAAWHQESTWSQTFHHCFPETAANLVIYTPA